MVTESRAEYRLRLRGNYRDKDMPRYDLNIAIFDTIRYILPSLIDVYHGLTDSAH